MDKLTRIKKSILNWRNIGRGRGIIIHPAGFSIIDTITLVIEKFRIKNPKGTIVIACKNNLLKIKYVEIFKDMSIYGINVKTYQEIMTGFNTIDLLIVLDSNSSINSNIYTLNNKFILGFSTSLERLDGKHNELLKHCKVVDDITIEECIENKWINKYKEYKLLIDVDLSEYKKHDEKFNKYFNFFDRNIITANKCLESLENRKTLASFKRVDVGMVNACTFGLFKEMKWRKDFIQSHPKKIELCNKIFNTFKNKKVITLSPTIDISKQLKGLHYNSKDKSVMSLDSFNSDNENENILNLCKMFDLDIKNCDVGVIISHDSSGISKSKILGMLNNSNSNPILFTFVLKGTIEEEWQRLSTGNLDYITINEKLFDRVLNNEEIIERKIEGSINQDRF